MFQQPGSSLLRDEIEACGSQINEWWSCHIFYPERKCSFVRFAAVTFHWNDIPLSFWESFYVLTTEVIVNISWSGHMKQIRAKRQVKTVLCSVRGSFSFPNDFNWANLLLPRSFLQFSQWAEREAVPLISVLLIRTCGRSSAAFPLL